MLTWKITIATLITLFSTNSLIYNYYPTTMAVVEVGDEYVTCVDFSGNEWAFEDNTGDWYEGDMVSAIFCDMGTEEIYDDEIIAVSYSGWCDSFGFDFESHTPLVTFNN